MANGKMNNSSVSSRQSHTTLNSIKKARVLRSKITSTKLPEKRFRGKQIKKEPNLLSQINPVGQTTDFKISDKPQINQISIKDLNSHIPTISTNNTSATLFKKEKVIGSSGRGDKEKFNDDEEYVSQKKFTILMPFEPYDSSYQPDDNYVYLTSSYEQFQNIDSIFHEMEVTEAKFQLSQNIPNPGWKIVEDYPKTSCKAKALLNKNLTTKEEGKALLKTKKTLKLSSQIPRIENKGIRSNLRSSSSTTVMEDSPDLSNKDIFTTAQSSTNPDKAHQQHDHQSIHEEVSDEVYARYHEKYETTERENKNDREWRKQNRGSLMNAIDVYNVPRGSRKHVPPVQRGERKRVPELLKDGLRSRHVALGPLCGRSEVEESADPKAAPVTAELPLIDNYTTRYPIPSFWPSLYDVQVLEVIQGEPQGTPATYPLTAFGRQVPKVEEKLFGLPWTFS